MNRTWLIESPLPMVYRLVESGGGLSRSFLEARVLEALRSGARSSKQAAEALGAPVGSVRNLLARLTATGAILMRPKNKRENE